MVWKKIRCISLNLICIAQIAFTGNAQNLKLDHFSGELRNNHYYISFTLTSGFTCNGVKIERSTDGLNYSEIGKINGWCGHLSFAVNYQFTDPNPVPNKMNYYRLQLGEEFNNRTTTESIKFEYITYDRNGVTVLQGANKQLRIFLKPGIVDNVMIEFYDITSRLLFKERTANNYFELQLPYSRSVGILRITSKNKELYKGRFLLN